MNLLVRISTDYKKAYMAKNFCDLSNKCCPWITKPLPYIKMQDKAVWKKRSLVYALVVQFCVLKDCRLCSKWRTRSSKPSLNLSCIFSITHFVPHCNRYSSILCAGKAWVFSVLPQIRYDKKVKTRRYLQSMSYRGRRCVWGLNRCIC